MDEKKKELREQKSRDILDIVADLLIINNELEEDDVDLKPVHLKMKKLLEKYIK